MCVIMILRPGQMPPLDMLENAVYNNWHSWGLVTRVNGLLDVKRVVPESGEVSPQEVWDALAKDREHERILHLRHTTAGSMNMENCHPFDVFYGRVQGEARQVVFMHNGTMHSYKSKKPGTYTGQMVDDNDGPSDTKNFVDQILVPLLASTDYGNGHGDIENEFGKKLLDNLWPSGDNKGILIANDQDALLLGRWETIKPIVGDTDTHFIASNNSYFSNVSRGPEHARRLARQAEEKQRKEEEARRKAEEERAANASKEGSKTKELASLKDFSFNSRTSLPANSSLLDVLDDVSFYDREHTHKIGYATLAEITAFVEQGSKPEHIREFTSLIDHVFTDYAYLYSEFTELKKKFEESEEKHRKATAKIAVLSTKLDESGAKEARVG